ncbi:hypothetical protein CCAX7_51870 [Capsulimonas corticalis]|uniref:Uncharacterized protein n=1 Tax=Capsulimonas corticalis TaxID=2219043 RepID=A0A402CNW4_9BACT|nr:hypothetical protein [Capsulimonas corticalis]BDI33136.1 hypothetical protein CCAX7_51870 [Capsulimonas corticalis]
MQILFGAFRILGKSMGHLLMLLTVGPVGLISKSAPSEVNPMSVQEIVMEAQRRDALAAAEDAPRPPQGV